jgi:hypothetical protein
VITGKNVPYRLSMLPAIKYIFFLWFFFYFRMLYNQMIEIKILYLHHDTVYVCCINQTVIGYSIYLITISIDFQISKQSTAETPFFVFTTDQASKRMSYY